jgi:hypothetical protein
MVRRQDVACRSDATEPRYLSEGSKALLTPTNKEVAPAQLMPA